MMYQSNPATYKRADIYTSELGLDIKRQLRELVGDPKFNTEDTYTTNLEKYPDGVMPFEDRQLLYMHTHPSLDPEHHIANLRIKLKLRG